MRGQLLILTVTAFSFVACSSSDYDQPQPRRGNRPGPDGGDGTFARARTTTGGLDMLPPPDWWPQPQIAAPLNLTSDQYAALDRIATEQAEEIARLDRDSMVAVRDLRQLLESNQPVSADIVAAGQRAGQFETTVTPQFAALAFYGVIEQVLTGWIFDVLPAGDDQFEQAKHFVIETICDGLDEPTRTPV